jgi:hypothetical protein
MQIKNLAITPHCLLDNTTIMQNQSSETLMVSHCTKICVFLDLIAQAPELMMYSSDSAEFCLEIKSQEKQKVYLICLQAAGCHQVVMTQNESSRSRIKIVKESAVRRTNH